MERWQASSIGRQLPTSPVWWEYVRLGLVTSEGDQEWKVLLRKHMDPHDDAEDFWNLCSNLVQYPEEPSVLWAVGEYLAAKEEELRCSCVSRVIDRSPVHPKFASGVVLEHEKYQA